MAGEQTSSPGASPVGGTPSSSPSSASSAPAPSSAPSSSGSSDGASGSGSQAGADTSSQDFDFLFGESTQTSPSPADLSPAQPAAQPQAAPEAPPVPPAQPQAAQPAAQTQPPAAGPQGVEQQPAQQGQSAAQSPAPNPRDPFALAQALQENATAAEDVLSREVFRLTEQDLQGLETDVAGTIPRLLARAVVFAQQQFLRQLGTLAPHIIQQHNEVLRAQMDHENSFYSAWPMLDRGKHAQTVRELGQRYRQMFPSHTTEQMIKNLGPLVLSSLGIPIPSAGQLAAPAAQSSAGAAPVVPQGFIPAAPGVAGVVNTADPYAYMGQRE